MPTAFFVVVSGLPGSGKSTLAGGMAERLSWPLIDKDVILETLFCGRPSAARSLTARIIVQAGS